jgi:hypothetical protein
MADTFVLIVQLLMNHEAELASYDLIVFYFGFWDSSKQDARGVQPRTFFLLTHLSAQADDCCGILDSFYPLSGMDLLLL